MAAPGYAWLMASRLHVHVRSNDRSKRSADVFVDVRFDGRRFKLRHMPVGNDWVRITSEDMAQAVAGAIRDAVANGRTKLQAVAPFLREGSPLAFGNQWDRFIEAKRRQGAHSRQLSAKRLSELESYKRRGYFDELVDVPVHMVTFGVLEDLVAQLFARELSPKSVWNVVRDVGTCLRWLHRRQELASVPELPTVSIPEHAPRIPSPQLLDRILEAIPLEDRGLFLARGRMGLRPSEAKRARATDYDRESRTLTVHAKGNRVRVLPVHDDVAEWAEVCPRPRAPGALLFARADGREWSDSAMRRVWTAACLEVGAVERVGDKVRPLFPPNEGLRHAFGTHAVNRGADLARVGRFLGHTNGRTTERYAKLAAESLLDVYDPTPRSDTPAESDGMRGSGQRRSTKSRQSGSQGA